MTSPTPYAIVKTTGLIFLSVLLGFIFSDKFSTLLRLNKVKINELAVVSEPLDGKEHTAFHLISNYINKLAGEQDVLIDKVDFIKARNVCDHVRFNGPHKLVIQVTKTHSKCAPQPNVVQFVFNGDTRFSEFVFQQNGTEIQLVAGTVRAVEDTLHYILLNHPNLRTSVFSKLFYASVEIFGRFLYLIPVFFLFIASFFLVDFLLFGRNKCDEEQDVALSPIEERGAGPIQKGHLPSPDAPPSYGAIARRPKKFDEQMPIHPAEFTKYMAQTVDFVVDYLENNEKYPVTTNREVGFIRDALPREAPFKPESFESIMCDMRNIILPGMTHWQHKRFHAFFPAGSSFPDIVANAMVASFGVVGFTYDACPAVAEMEMAMVNWFGRALGLPESFLSSSGGDGGGTIQSSASDCIYLPVMSARYQKIKECLKAEGKEMGKFKADEAEKLGLLVAYSSPEAHSSFEKACKMAMVRLHTVESDDNFSLRGAALEKQIKEDIRRGLIPFHVHCTLGTTGICSFDNLTEVGRVAKKYNLWFHVDGAYAGSAMICPEFRFLMKGIEYADSFNVNPHKFLLQSVSQSFIWTQRITAMKEQFLVQAAYYKNNDNKHDNDPRHFGVPLGRRFNGIRLWFLFRMYGIQGLQAYIRRLVGQGAIFERLIRADNRLEIIGKRELGLVGFRLKNVKGDVKGTYTQDLVHFINTSQKMMVTHSFVKGIHVCRVCVTRERSTESDILESWTILKGLIGDFLEFKKNNPGSTVSENGPRNRCNFTVCTPLRGDKR